ncbi:MAG: chloride channel protein [Acidimicrobiia bacterium]|nr:chloride channel protein [Acidimicrobiia bacterium]MBP8179579.1 chloride channel protein [Acidimicrobiia bacterium]
MGKASTRVALWRKRVVQRFAREADARRLTVQRWQRQWQRTLLLAMFVGIIVGLAVAVFDYVTAEVVAEWVDHLPNAARMIAPGFGLLGAMLALRYLGNRASPSNSDVYVQNYHSRAPFPYKPVPARMLAAALTLGSGVPLGYEGPSVYLGAAIGAKVQDRFHRMFSTRDSKLLMTAGTAAAVAAIFKAPATGALFAIEVPYRDDSSGRSVLPALIAAAASYLTFIALNGSQALLPLFTASSVTTPDLGAAALVGLLSGLGARLFAMTALAAKHTALHIRWRYRVVIASVGIAAIAAISLSLTDEFLTLGAGYNTIRWATNTDVGVGLVVAIFAFRWSATLLALSGGGVGGVFVSLAALGALLGRSVSGMLNESSTSTLLPLVGMAAFLGAGYRTPIAAVMFVAETTTRADFVVPGIIATALAQLVMGPASIAPDQRSRRAGAVERRLRLPVTAAISRDALTVPSATSIDDYLRDFLPSAGSDVVPVVDDGVYLGVMTPQSLENVDKGMRAVTTVNDTLRVDVTPAALTWNLRKTVQAMERSGLDRIPVVDGERYVGIIDMRDIVRVSEMMLNSDAR